MSVGWGGREEGKGELLSFERLLGHFRYERRVRRGDIFLFIPSPFSEPELSLSKKKKTKI